MVGTIPLRSSLILSQWEIEYEEEDLASGGRSELGGRAAPQPYRAGSGGAAAQPYL